ncbi:hypothetical protein ACIBO2_35320 [Nonomuraea sp. NPDC050022]|uniref:hypothetical protein n=1 Tax=Nonomuraea sp. NPDC050022 TaxID=3364358 RepID=UPI0037B1C752
MTSVPPSSAEAPKTAYATIRESRGWRPSELLANPPSSPVGGESGGDAFSLLRTTAVFDDEWLAAEVEDHHDRGVRDQREAWLDFSSRRSNTYGSSTA